MSQYLKLNENRDKEVSIAFFDDPQSEKDDIEFMRNRVSKSKGKMQPLKDFSYKFYGNGKVITIEGKNGKSALFASDEETDYYYMLLLHRPKPGAPLEIIR